MLKLRAYVPGIDPEISERDTNLYISRFGRILNIRIIETGLTGKTNIAFSFADNGIKGLGLMTEKGHTSFEGDVLVHDNEIEYHEGDIVVCGWHDKHGQCSWIMRIDKIFNDEPDFGHMQARELVLLENSLKMEARADCMGVYSITAHDWIREPESDELEKFFGKYPRFKDDEVVPLGSQDNVDVKPVVEGEIQLKPFDRVLVWSKMDGKWRPDLFWEMSGDKYRTIFGLWEKCVRYEGNEHLVKRN